MRESLKSAGKTRRAEIKVPMSRRRLKCYRFVFPSGCFGSCFLWFLFFLPLVFFGHMVCTYRHTHTHTQIQAREHKHTLIHTHTGARAQPQHTRTHTYTHKWRNIWGCTLQIRAGTDDEMQRTATHYNTLQRTATHYNTLQHIATHCNTLQHIATHCSTLQHTATHCNTLQHTATHGNTRQHTATHCNTDGKIFGDGPCGQKLVLDC